MQRGEHVADNANHLVTRRRQALDLSLCISKSKKIRLPRGSSPGKNIFAIDSLITRLPAGDSSRRRRHHNG